MMSAPNGLMQRYLAGQLSEEEKTSFEERYFTDDEVFEELVSLENDLVDDYVTGRLSGRDRQLLESEFLRNPHAAANLQFAREFIHVSPREFIHVSRSTDRTGVGEVLSYVSIVVGMAMGCALISEAFNTTRGLTAKCCFFVAAFVLLSEVAFLAVQHAYRTLCSRAAAAGEIVSTRRKWSN
jgi:hypothetical protein